MFPNEQKNFSTLLRVFQLYIEKIYTVGPWICLSVFNLESRARALQTPLWPQPPPTSSAIPSPPRTNLSFLPSSLTPLAGRSRRGVSSGHREGFGRDTFGQLVIYIRLNLPIIWEFIRFHYLRNVPMCQFSLIYLVKLSITWSPNTSNVAISFFFLLVKLNYIKWLYIYIYIWNGYKRGE